jgi:hypothetical protein
VLSTGFGRLGANPNNTYSGYPTGGMQSQPANTGMTDDTHLRAAAVATGPGTPLATQQLVDISILEFDITPTISGPLIFRYVFGEGPREQQQQLQHRTPCRGPLSGKPQPGRVCAWVGVSAHPLVFTWASTSAGVR